MQSLPTQIEPFFPPIKKLVQKKKSHSIKIYHFQITVKGT